MTHQQAKLTIARLDTRQKSVLTSKCMGWSRKQIAAVWKCSGATVDTILNDTFEALGLPRHADSVGPAAVLAVRGGLV